MVGYTIKVSRRNGAVLATCPDFPEVTFNCANGQDTLARANDLLERAISVRMANGHDIPKPSPGHHRANLSAQTTIKVRVYQAAYRDGVSRRELARRLGWRSAQVDRLFDLKRSLRLDQIDAVCRVLGLRLTLDVEAAGPPQFP